MGCGSCGQKYARPPRLAAAAGLKTPASSASINGVYRAAQVRQKRQTRPTQAPLPNMGANNVAIPGVIKEG